MPPMPAVTQALLLLNVAVFCIDIFLGPWFTRLFALWPVGAGFLPWQMVSYSFLHGSITHLFFNMLGLWMFGGELEQQQRAPLVVAGEVGEAREGAHALGAVSVAERGAVQVEPRDAVLGVGAHGLLVEFRGALRVVEAVFEELGAERERLGALARRVGGLEEGVVELREVGRAATPRVQPDQRVEGRTERRARIERREVRAGRDGLIAAHALLVLGLLVLEQRAHVAGLGGLQLGDDEALRFVDLRGQVVGERKRGL